MKAKQSFVATVCVLFLLASCGSAKNLETAERGVIQFHSELDSEQFGSIYEAADEGLHKFTTKTDFIRSLEGVHRKLGKVQHSQLVNFESGWLTNQGTVVTLAYETSFLRGSGTEQFVWHIHDKRAVLFGYNITSNVLIEK